jgi:hypothetical protein
MNSNKDRHRLRRRGTRFGEDCVKTEFRRTQRDIILLAIEPFSGSPRRLSLDFLLTLCLFFIGVRELRYASVASFVLRQKKKEIYPAMNCLLAKTTYLRALRAGSPQMT